jgi:hypothetical protein
VTLVGENSRWEHDDEPFFSGEVEPFINGLAVALGAYFRQDVQAIVGRLLTEQLSDGGWNCEAERGSTRSSFNTTIAVLEGLLQHEHATGATADAGAARHKGQEYLLDRRMFRRLSTGEAVNDAWTSFSYPTWFYYDVLRGLDYLALPAPYRTSGSPRQSAWSRSAAARTADGHCRTPIRASFTSPWTRATDSPAVGTPFAPYGSCAGTTRVAAGTALAGDPR